MLLFYVKILMYFLQFLDLIKTCRFPEYYKAGPSVCTEVMWHFTWIVQYLKTNLIYLRSDIESDDDSDKEIDTSKEQSDTVRAYSLSGGDEYNFSNYDNECRSNI